MKLGLALVFAWLGVGPTVLADMPVEDVGAHHHSQELIQFGARTEEHFGMHRFRRQDALSPELSGKPVLLLLPSTGASFKQYFYPTRTGELPSLAESLADQGYWIYGFSPPTTDLPAGYCAQRDCEFARGWGLGLYRNMVSRLREEITHAHPNVPVVIGGLSMGAILTWAVLDAKPEDYAGAIIWEGANYLRSPALRAANQVLCQTHRTRLAAGTTLDAVLLPRLKTTQLSHPRLFSALFSSFNPFVAGIPWFKMAEGDLFSGTLTHADPDRTRHMIQNANDVESVRLMADVTCALAGERTYTSGLSNWKGPILAIGSEHGYGRLLADQISLTDSKSVEWVFHQGMGHADAFLSPQRRDLLELPLLNWLKVFHATPRPN